MIVKKSFEEWLQQFNKELNIQEIENEDIDVLYWGSLRLCSIPKGLKNSRGWTDTINASRREEGMTTHDGIKHRTLTGVGLVLWHKKLITKEQFITHFTTRETKEAAIKKVYGPNVEIIG